MSSLSYDEPIVRLDRGLAVRDMLRKLGLTAALREDITEVAINRPGGYWVEDAHGWRQIEAPDLTLERSLRLSQAAGVLHNGAAIDVDAPIASVTLPDGERCQIVLPPACESGTVSMTIRKPSASRFTLDDYERTGRLKPVLATLTDAIQPWEAQMVELAANGQIRRFFELAVEHCLNIVTVGGTGSGKTTFCKALIDQYPSSRRLITIEDTFELTTPKHPNAVHLFYSGKLPPKTVLASCMRMKPDHIFLTELRGDEAWNYLVALNSGHPGSITSVHANDCQGALHQIGDYIKQSEIGRTLDASYIMQKVWSTIDVVAYFRHGHCTEIYYEPVKKLATLRGNA